MDAENDSGTAQGRGMENQLEVESGNRRESQLSEESIIVQMGALHLGNGDNANPNDEQNNSSESSRTEVVSVELSTSRPQDGNSVRNTAVNRQDYYAELQDRHQYLLEIRAARLQRIRNGELDENEEFSLERVTNLRGYFASEDEITEDQNIDDPLSGLILSDDEYEETDDEATDNEATDADSLEEALGQIYRSGNIEGDISPSRTALCGKVEQLPTYQVTSQQVEDDLQCIVCLQEYELEETVCQTPCKHYFHADCLTPWIKTNPTCPVCRQQVFAVLSD